MFNFQTENRIFATGNLSFGLSKMHVNISVDYKENSISPVNFTMWSDDPDQENLFNLAMRYPRASWFGGRTENGLEILLMGIEVHHLKGINHIEGTTALYIEGDFNSIRPNESDIYIKATLSPTPLIQVDVSYIQSNDGTITKSRDKPSKNIEWQTPKGNVLLHHEYDYPRDRSHTDEIVLQIRKNILNYTHNPEVETDFKAILTEFPNWIAEELILLSFLGRRRIVCYEATAVQNRGNNRANAYARYKPWQGFFSKPSDNTPSRCLVRPASLKDGLFASLLQNYLKSKYKDVIYRTILNLLATYEDGYVEAHLASAYAALESMVDGIGELDDISYTLGSNPFKRLRKSIEKLIDSEVENDEVREAIKKKLPELRRRSFLNRLFTLLERMNVSMDAIWPENIDQQSEFHEIIKRRNTLIHQGYLGNTSISRFDLSRVQRLVELWILKLLDCPDEAINDIGLRLDAPINEVLHY